MKSIHPLIHTLSRGERKVTRTALTCFSGKKDSVTKTLKLFDFLVKNKMQAPSNGECAMHIYGDPKDKRFKMLKLRFKQKLLDALSLDFNLYKKELLDAADLEHVIVRKKMAQLYHLYFSKGDLSILKKMLNEIIEVSKKYECYLPLIDALRFLKYSKGYLKGENDYNIINKKIAFYESCNHAVHKAHDYYHRLMVHANFNAKTDSTKIQVYLEKSIAELRKDFKNTESAMVGYILKLLEISYFENDANYHSALQSCDELLSIVENNRSVYRKSRMCAVYLNLCQFNIFLRQYKEAIANARLAQKFVSFESIYHTVSQEWEFNALFHEDALQEAEVLIISLIEKASKIKDDDFRLAKYHFYHTAVLFKKGDYKRVVKELNVPLEISKDKEGWGTAIRVLTIMALIEMNRFDEVSPRLDSLRKHIERNAEKNATSEREKIILRLLQTLENAGFIINARSEKRLNEYLKLLSGEDKKYKWKPLGSELIPFHEWVTKKFTLKKK